MFTRLGRTIIQIEQVISTPAIIIRSGLVQFFPYTVRLQKNWRFILSAFILALVPLKLALVYRTELKC